MKLKLFLQVLYELTSYLLIFQSTSVGNISTKLYHNAVAFLHLIGQINALVLIFKVTAYTGTPM